MYKKLTLRLYLRGLRDPLGRSSHKMYATWNYRRRPWIYQRRCSIYSSVCCLYSSATITFLRENCSLRLHSIINQNFLTAFYRKCLWHPLALSILILQSLLVLPVRQGNLISPLDLFELLMHNSHRGQCRVGSPSRLILVVLRVLNKFSLHPRLTIDHKVTYIDHHQKSRV